jgi:hypothetical protein
MTALRCAAGRCAADACAARVRSRFPASVRPRILRCNSTPERCRRQSAAQRRPERPLRPATNQRRTIRGCRQRSGSIVTRRPSTVIGLHVFQVSRPEERRRSGEAE